MNKKLNAFVSTFACIFYRKHAKMVTSTLDAYACAGT